MEQTMTHQTSILWLKIASVLLIDLGLLFFIATFTQADLLVRLLLDVAIWPYDGAQTIVAPESRILMAISGGVMAGWGVMAWLVTTQVYAKDPETGGRMFLFGVGTWFVIDSLGSIFVGAAMNALINVSFLMLFFVPVLLAAKRHSQESVGDIA